MTNGLQDNTTQALERYLRLMRLRAGLEKPTAPSLSRFGLPIEQAESLMAAIAEPRPAPPEPTRRSILQKIGAPIGFYVTQAVPSFAEMAFRPIIEDWLEWRYGAEARREYEDENEAVALKFKQVVAEQGFVGAIDDWMRLQAGLRKERPKLFWGEKFFGEVIADPSTYIGWGLLKKLPTLGKLGLDIPIIRDIGPGLLDIAAEKASQLVFTPARWLREGAFATGHPLLKFILPIAPAEEALAGRAGVKSANLISQMVGAEGMLEDAPSSSAAVIAFLRDLAYKGAVPDALTPLALDMAAAEKLVRLQAMRVPVEGSELLVKTLKAAGGELPDTGEFLETLGRLKPSELGAKMGEYAKIMTRHELDDEYTNWIRGHTKALQVFQEFGNSATADWFATKFMRYAVVEPARAILVFLNYGPFNLVEDYVRSILSGHSPSPLDLDVLRQSWAGFAVPEMLGKEASEYSNWARAMGAPVRELPWMLNVPGVRTVSTQIIRSNLFFQELGAKVRRGTFFQASRDTLKRNADAIGYYKTGPGAAVEKLLHSDIPGVSAKTAKSLAATAEVLALRGEFDAIPSLAALVEKGHIRRDEVRAILKDFTALHPDIRDELVETIADGGVPSIVGERRNVLLTKLRDAEVDRIRASPELLAERLDALINKTKAWADASVFTPTDATKMVKLMGAFVSNWLDQPTIQRNLLMPRKPWGAAVPERQLRGRIQDTYDERVRTIGETAERQFIALKDVLHHLEDRLVATKAGSPATIDAAKRQLSTMRRFLDQATAHFKWYREGQLELHSRFFPEGRMGSGPDRWKAEIDDLVKGRLEVLDEIPVEWRQVLERATPPETVAGVMPRAAEAAVPPVGVEHVAPTAAVRPLAGPPDVRELMRLGGYTKPLTTVEDMVKTEREVARTMRRFANNLESGKEDLLTGFSLDDIDERLGVELPRLPSDIDSLDTAKAIPFLRAEAEKVDQGIAGRVKRLEISDMERQEKALTEGMRLYDESQAAIPRTGVAVRPVVPEVAREVPSPTGAIRRAGGVRNAQGEYVGLRKALEGATTTETRHALRQEIVDAFWHARDEASFVLASTEPRKALIGWRKLVQELEQLDGVAVLPPLAAAEHELDQIAAGARQRLMERAEAVQTELGTAIVDELGQVFERLDSLVSQHSLRPGEVGSIRAWLESMATYGRQLDPQMVEGLKAASPSAYDNGITAVKQAYTNYDDSLIMDGYMKAVFPFWVYQSRSWPWLAAAMLSHPGLAVSLLPEGRFWQNTDDGYLPMSIAAMQPMPLRGSVFGRLRRSFRGTFPPMFGGPLGEVEHLLESVERVGLFPGTFWTTLAETALAFGGGESVQVIGSLLTESLPAPLANIVEGMIAAGRVLGPTTTTTLAETLFPSRFRSYYAEKMLFDAHGVSISEARRQGHEDWVADAYVAVALRQIVEEQISLTRINPDSWAALKQKIVDITMQDAGLTPEQYKALEAEARTGGKRLSEILPVSRLTRAKIGLLEGIEALSEAGRILSPAERRQHLTVRADYFSMREAVRDRDRIQQEADDNSRMSGTMSGREWRDNLFDRRRQYQGLADVTKSEYFSQMGLTDVERLALHEKLGIAPAGAHPVDLILDGLFAMVPLLDDDGQLDWATLRQVQNDMLKALPDDAAKEIRDYLARNQTPLEREFWDGLLATAPYWETEKGIPDYYRRMGGEGQAATVEWAYAERRRLLQQKNFALANQQPVPYTVVRSLLLAERLIRRETTQYRAWLLADPSTAAIMAPYLAKFWDKQLKPVWIGDLT